MSWWRQYLGQPYDQADCAELVRQVNAEQFGRAVDLPTYRDGGVRAGSRQIIREVDVYGVRTERPSDGDCVVMRQGSRLAHVGVYAEKNGKPHVLHALKNAGTVVFHAFTALDGVGLEVEGVYRLSEVRDAG